VPGRLPLSGRFGTGRVVKPLPGRMVLPGRVGNPPGIGDGRVESSGRAAAAGGAAGRVAPRPGRGIVVGDGRVMGRGVLLAFGSDGRAGFGLAVAPRLGR